MDKIINVEKIDYMTNEIPIGTYNKLNFVTVDKLKDSINNNRINSKRIICTI